MIYHVTHNYISIHGPWEYLFFLFSIAAYVKIGTTKDLGFIYASLNLCIKILMYVIYISITGS